MAWVRVDIAEIVAKMDGPRDAVENLARRIGSRAESNLREHYNEGETSIEVNRLGEGPDWYVALLDEGGAAGAIERGGTRRNGKPFDGLHIVGRAIGGA